MCVVADELHAMRWDGQLVGLPHGQLGDFFPFFCVWEQLKAKDACVCVPGPCVGVRAVRDLTQCRRQ